MVSTRDTKKEATDAMWSMARPAPTRRSRPLQIRVHHSPVTVQRKDQGDVDIDPSRSCVGDRRQACQGRGDLDQQVGPVDALPELLGLDQRRCRVMRR